MELPFIVPDWSDLRENTKEQLETIYDELFPDDFEILGIFGSVYLYEESMKVLFVSGGKLWLNEASHCSCNDFIGAWVPDEVGSEELVKYDWWGVDKKEWADFVAALKERGF